MNKNVSTKEFEETLKEIKKKGKFGQFFKLVLYKDTVWKIEYEVIIGYTGERIIVTRDAIQGSHGWSSVSLYQDKNGKPYVAADFNICNEKIKDRLLKYCITLDKNKVTD